MSELREDTKRALRMLGSVAPPEGMEARVAARVRERRAELSAGSAPENIWRWSLAAVGALAIAAVVLSGRHHVGSVPQVVETPPRVMPAHAAAVEVKQLRRRTVHAATRSDVKFAASQVAPPLPLTQQEKLLLSLARRSGVVSGLGSIAESEAVTGYGLGENSIFELDHEELAQLKTTLQPAPLQNTLPQLNHPGDIE